MNANATILSIYTNHAHSRLDKCNLIGNFTTWWLITILHVNYFNYGPASFHYFLENSTVLQLKPLKYDFPYHDSTKIQYLLINESL